MDASANDASRSIAQIIKLTQTDKGNFADALGTGEVTVANGAVLCFLWYDTDVDQAVFGYSDETTAGDSDNKITKADTFVEIVRLPEALDYYRSKGLNLWQYIYTKNYSLKNFFNYFFIILIGGKKRGLNYINFKNHFLKNLIYPNAWLSIFYFIARKLRLMIIK